jgi:hypothetical protein
VEFLTPTEQAYLNNTKDFTNDQKRYIRCRLKKKLRQLGGDELNSCSVAAMEHERCNALNGVKPSISSGWDSSSLCAMVRPRAM